MINKEDKKKNTHIQRYGYVCMVKTGMAINVQDQL